VHTHFGDGEQIFTEDSDKFTSSEALDSLFAEYPPIIPVRDPLLALLTRRNRHPNLKHFYIVNGFVTLVELVLRRSIFILPVDILKGQSYTNRYRALVKMTEFVGLEPEPNLRLYSAGWPKVNSVGAVAKETNAAYLAQDANVLRGFIPEEWDYLKANEEKLKPFLKSLGYKKLLWWG